MAIKGNFAAYKQLTPINQDFGNDALQAAELARRNRREQRLEQQRIDAKNQKLINDLALSNSKLKPFDTKHKGLNSYIYKVVEEAKDHLPNLYKTVNNPNATMDQRIEAQSAIYNLEQLPASLKAMTTGITDHIASQMKGLANGSLIPSKKYKDFMTSGFDTANLNGLEADIILDKNYQPVMLYKKGFGKKEVEAITFNQFINKDLPSNRRNVDLDSLVANHQKMIGTQRVQTESGYVTRDVKKANQPSLDFLDRATNELFYIDNNGKMSDAMYSVWVGRLGRNPNEINQTSVDEMRDVYKKRVLAGLDTHDITDVDYSAINAANRLARDKQKDAKEWATPEIAKDSQTGEVQITNDGYVVTLGGHKLELPSDGKTKRKLTNFVMGDDGQIKGIVETEKEIDFMQENASGEKVLTKQKEYGQQTITLDNTEFNNMARNSKMRKENGDKFKDGKELKDFIESKYSEFSTPADKYGLND